MGELKFFFRPGLLWLGFSMLLGQAGAQEAPPTAAADGVRVKVISWNLEWYPGLKPEPTLEAEAQHEKELMKALPSLGADVICVQEVVSARSLTRAVNSVPGLKVAFTSDFADAPQETAVISRYPVIEKGAVAFTANGPVQPPRGFTFAALDVGEGDALVVYSLHLKSNRGEAAENFAMRQEAALQVTKHALATVERLKADGQKRRVAALVAGDFNSDPQNGKWEGDGTWSAFAKAGFKWSWEGVELKDRNSWVGNERFEPTCFDHIMVLARDGLASGKAHLLEPAVRIGDHLPVALEVVW
jgi:endonuclease/exonuclease/phosphatase family metal-dependent hydrolase